MSQAKIEVRTKDVINIPGKKDPQHSYIILTLSDDKQYILRGGPADRSALAGDLYVTGTDSLLQYQEATDGIHHDWDDPKDNVIPSSALLATGTDAEILSKFQTMQAEGRRINEAHYDYEWLRQNCNTAAAYMDKAAGFTPIIPQKDGQNVYMPGIDSGLSYGPVDITLDYLEEIFSDDINELNFNFDTPLQLTKENTDIKIITNKETGSAFLNLFYQEQAIPSWAQNITLNTSADTYMVKTNQTFIDFLNNDKQNHYLLNDILQSEANYWLYSDERVYEKYLLLEKGEELKTPFAPKKVRVDGYEKWLITENSALKSIHRTGFGFKKVTYAENIITIDYYNDRCVFYDTETETIALRGGAYLSSADLNLIIQDMAAFTARNEINISSIEDVKRSQQLTNMVFQGWHG